MGLYTIGVSAITIGAIATDGGPGTTLASLGYTTEGSAKLTQADPETTEFFVEETDDAVYTKNKRGKVTLEFSISNPDADTLVALFGGSATGNSPNKIWNMPATIPVIEKTVKVAPSEGFSGIIIPRGSLTAKLNGSMTKKDLFVVDVMVTALIPTKSGVGPIQFIS